MKINSIPFLKIFYTPKKIGPNRAVLGNISNDCFIKDKVSFKGISPDSYKDKSAYDVYLDIDLKNISLKFAKGQNYPSEKIRTLEEEIDALEKIYEEKINPTLFSFEFSNVKKDGQTQRIETPVYKQEYDDDLRIRLFNEESDDNCAELYCFEDQDDSFIEGLKHPPKDYVGSDGHILPSLYVCDFVGSGNGSGTRLMKAAIRLSQKMGLGGKIILHAKNSLNPENSPIPFYFKLGFRALDSDLQEKIEKGMESLKTNGIYDGPKDEIGMYLPIENISALLER